MKLHFTNKTKKRLAVFFLAVLMSLSITLTPITNVSGSTLLSHQTQSSVSFKNVTGQMDFSKVKLDNLSDYVMANVDTSKHEDRAVIVSLKEDSLIDRAGDNGVSSYLSSFDGQNQKRRIDAQQSSFLSNLTKLGVKYDFITDYDTVLNGVAIKVNTSYIPVIKLIDGVESVVISETYNAPQTVEENGTSASDITNETSVYQTGIYNSEKYAEKYGGKGMVVAVLDTGLDYTHEAFQKPISDAKYSEEDIYNLMITKKDEFSAKGDVYVSEKIPFAYDYADRDADVYPSYSNHGTHVAGIIAGSADSYTDKDGFVPTDENDAPIPFKSVAPNAQLVICKVFTDDLDSKNVGGAETQDILDALDDCVALGVDVINMSLGTTCGFSTTDDNAAEADPEGHLLADTYNAIQDAGISLICAASNDYSSAYGGAFGTNLTSNPDSGTVGSPSTFSSALSVASISGKKSPYVLANDKTAVFYNESSDENSVDYDFAKLMLGNKASSSFKYVVIKGSYYGSSADYNADYVKKAVKSAKDEGEKIIALVKRGGNLTFQEKVEYAMSAKFDAIIVYNNVAGEIKMTIGDVDDPIPAISISYEAGQNMVKGAKSNIGTITINPSEYSAGPFMSNFSSWGVTSDLKLKPEITAHGGEITSSVPGGWDEQSGTSMATPNVAGLVANIRSFIDQEWEKFFDAKPTSKQITQLANQLMMSTATIVVDQEGLAYSPRKQGAGLASLENIIDKTSAYLYTVSSEQIQSAHGNYCGADDNRPKLELGEDEGKVGKYTLQFYVNNVNQSATSFKLNSLFMTESVSLAGLSVGEQAYMLGGDASWTIDGVDGVKKDGDVISIPGKTSTKISVTLTLSKDEKAYLDKNFENGMYVEGFLRLQSNTDGQCDLNLPFMGFYGDWDAAPMLDYDAFEISKIEQDASILEDEKPKASVWATQAYAIYWNDKYVLPMGSFVYKQNEDDDEVRKIYTTEEFSSISCYNEYTDADSNNYMTSTGIKGIYAGLLRNAKQVDCRMYNVDTGELIYSKEVYRVNKAYSNGGSTTPGFVKLELTPSELGLVENGQYRMEFDFHYRKPDENTVVDPENTFNFSFYVDYTAPVLEDARVRYYDYKDGNKDKQRIYLDLDVYDNHYSMAALLCYLDETNPTNPELQLCTEYVTPIYDSKKNGTTTVSIEITDILEKYGDNLYVELDDYALNHSVYQINVSDAQKSPLPSSFSLAEGEEDITIGKLEKHKVNLVWNEELYPNANLSNFIWTVSGKSTSIIAVKNGEIVGLAAGEGIVTVSNGRTSKEIKVTVTDNDGKLNYPSISFDVILNAYKAPVKAQGVVEVNIDQDIKLNVLTDPWYYPVEDLDLVWTTSNDNADEKIATVDQDGNVKLLKKGRVTIMATIRGTAYSTTVMLDVLEPFKVSNFSLTGYEGAGGVVYIPKDMNIMTIGEDAFKDKTDITSVIIPKTVTTIDARAFYGCTNLKHVFFVDVETQEIAESDLTLINWEAFAGCTSLEYVDFSNCKTFTVASRAFMNCSSLKFIKGVEHIGTAYDNAFVNCSSLIGSISSQSGVLLVNPEKTVWDEKTNRITEIEALTFEDLKDENGEDLIIDALDISGLHVAGAYVFQGCTSIKDVKTAQFTALGVGMFSGCKGLTNVTIDEVGSIGAYAFEKCFGLKKVIFNTENCQIGDGAFQNSGNLIEIDFTNASISSIGNRAFENTSLRSFTVPNGLKQLDDQILFGTDVTQVNISRSALESIELIGNPFKGMTILVDGLSSSDGIVLSGDAKTLIYVNPDANLNAFVIPTSVEKIGDYAFANSEIKEISIPAKVTGIGNGAFKNSALEKITFAEGSLLSSIGSEAFYGAKIKGITLPSTVISVGDYAFADSSISSFNFVTAAKVSFGDAVFANCQSLVKIDLSGANVTDFGSYTFANAISLSEVKLPSIKNLGEYTFRGAINLQKVEFGQNSSTTGVKTFCTDSYSGTVTPYEKLETVTLGDNIEKIGAYAFVFCTALKTIDIKNVILVEDYAFFGCISLDEVVGLKNVQTFGSCSFFNCRSLTDLQLDNAITIGDNAFRINREVGEKAALQTIDMPNVKTIGAYAFYGFGAATISLPASLAEGADGAKLESDVYNVDGVAYGKKVILPIGEGAFANAPNLSEIKVAKENSTYFAESGVLYRRISDGTYELVAYPAACKTTADYVIKEKTVRIEAYAFEGSAYLKTVTMPYSVNSIGAGAFYGTLIEAFTFNSHHAPKLESEYTPALKDYLRIDISFRGMFYNNFIDYVLEYTDEVSSIASGNVSTLSMTYPKNGVGYDNYLYRKYFSVRKQSVHVLTDEARTVKENLESVDLDEISAWLNSAFAVNDDNRDKVVEFSNLIKETHRLYNNVSGDKNQLSLINQGEDNSLKLSKIEEELRKVKAKFDIENVIKYASFGGDYKKNYVEGETFDMTNLIITIHYDDYSTEDFTGSALKLADSSNKPLTSLNRSVKVECMGETCSVDISVSKRQDSQIEKPTENNGDGSSAWIIIVIVSAVLLAGGGLAAFIIIKKKRQCVEAKDDETVTDGTEEIEVVHAKDENPEMLDGDKADGEKENE